MWLKRKGYIGSLYRFNDVAIFATYVFYEDDYCSDEYAN